ncbi:MAG: long-chain fatty acid--CoA ligase [Flavobacteriaceae bacterium]|nr:long-chain fatty acid--CoA ligase [Flavobacteriaceae bacterium]
MQAQIERLDPDFPSLHSFFIHAAHQIHQPNRPAIFAKEDGKWESYSYADILAAIDQLCAWFMEIGLEKGDRVAIVADNCPDYYMIDQSIQKLGLVNVSIYPTLTPVETAYIINNSGAKVLFVGNAFLFKKFKKVQAECPSIKHVVSLPSDLENGGMFTNFNALRVVGQALIEKYKDSVETRFRGVVKTDLATLIYTSGTTGMPKGVMLTHSNFMSNCYDAKELCPTIDKDDVYLSFLPLSHIFERLATMYLSTFIGAQVAFAENIDKVAQNIQEIRPTLMACVPRLLERVHDKVYKSATEKGGISAKIFIWSLKVGGEARKKRDAGKFLGPILALQLAIANKLVYTKIKAKMGGRLKIFISGAGALPIHVGEFFANLGMRVQEGYGLTETSPLVTVNEYNRQVYGTVGRVAPRQQVAIQNIETKEILCVQNYDSFDPVFASEEGEILVKGPNVMQGYYNNKAATDEVFTDDGWFLTGDIGRFDRGYLRITDRLKNMLKTSLGKNIYPTQIENVLLKSHRLEQVFIIGDKREYLTAIIHPNMDELKSAFGGRKDYFESSDPFIQDEEIKKWMQEDVKKLGENLSKFERIKDFIIKREPFSVEAGDMTITLKIKRKVVMEKYEVEIDSLYP